MKYVVVLGDGMADQPIEELGGKTPLEYAKTPMMDELAKVITADRVICPDMQAHAVYEKQRVVFNELYARNRDLMKSL